MQQAYLAMAVFALVGAITPGPVNILAISQSLQHGWHSGLLLVIGASVGYTAIVLLLAVSLQAWVLNPNLLPCLQLLASAYLVHLAWRIAHAPVHTATTQAMEQTTAATVSGQWRVLQTGLLSQCINPKAWLYALAGVGLYTQHGGLRSVLAFSIISFLGCSLGVGTWAMLGGVLQSHLQSAARQRLANRVLAVLLLATLWPLLA